MRYLLLPQSSIATGEKWSSKYCLFYQLQFFLKNVGKKRILQYKTYHQRSPSAQMKRTFSNWCKSSSISTVTMLHLVPRCCWWKWNPELQRFKTEESTRSDRPHNNLVYEQKNDCQYSAKMGICKCFPTCGWNVFLENWFCFSTAEKYGNINFYCLLEISRWKRWNG